MNTNDQLIQGFFHALASGQLPDDMVTDDMVAWTLTSGEFSRSRFEMGIKLLSSIFGGTLVYTVDSTTSEEDRVVTEVHSEGTLVNGDDFHNLHVFIFQITDGKISSMREYMNPIIVNEKLAPLIQREIEKMSK